MCALDRRLLSTAGLFLVILTACHTSREEQGQVTAELETVVLDHRQDGPLHHIGEGAVHRFAFDLEPGTYITVEVHPVDQSVLVFLERDPGPNEKPSIKTTRRQPESLVLAAQEAQRFQLWIKPFSIGGSYTLRVVEEGELTRDVLARVGIQERYWAIAAQLEDSGIDADEIARLKALYAETDPAVHARLRLRMLDHLVHALYETGNPLASDLALRAVEIRDHQQSPTLLASIWLRGLLSKRDDPERTLDLAFRLMGLEPGEGPFAENILGYQCSGLISAGGVFSYLHQHQVSLELCRRALPMARRLGDLRLEAACLQIIGQAYVGLGDTERMRGFLDEADALWAKRAARGEWTDHQGLGMLDLLRGLYHRERGEYGRAFALFRKTAARLPGDRFTPAHLSTYDKIGVVLTRMGCYDEALAYFERNLRVEPGVALGKTYMEMATVCALMAEREGTGGLTEPRVRALSFLDRARELVGERDMTVAANISLLTARLYRETGETDPEPHFLYALELIEAQREQIKENRTRGELYASNQYFFSSYIDFLLDRKEVGDVPAALVVAERARARTLLDAYADGPARQRRHFDWDLMASYWRARHRLEAAPDDPALRVEVARLAEERRRRERPGLVHEEIVDAEAIRAVAGAETLILAYHLDDAVGRVWVVTDREITVHPLPGRGVLEPLIRTLRDSLRARADDAAIRARRQAVTRLSEILLEPIGEIPKRERLALVADGPLQLLPFSMLRDPGQGDVPLGARYRIAVLPSVSVLSAMRDRSADRPDPRGDLAVFADPKYRPGSNRQSSSTRSPEDQVFLPLPASKREARAILALFPGNRSLVAMGADATKDKAVSSTEYRFLHFATHGEIDPVNPGHSSLVLSLYDRSDEPRDGFLTLTEISALELSADMVVLSACRTGLGREVRGEGLMSLARGFMFAGAPTIVATLWQVSDTSTRILMTDFYRNLIDEGMNPDQALQAARESLRDDPRYTDPYYWAPFVLIGDWRLGENQ